MNGRGVATYADGTRFDGEFRDGTFTGPTTELAFWTNALAKPVEQRIDVGPPELVTHIALDNIRNGFPNRPRTAQLSAEFLADVRRAFAELPDAVKRQAAAKLAGIYLIENIGGSGYVDQAYGPDGKPKVGFIILDPIVLAKQTANGWATWKENTPFKPDSAMRLEARIALDADDNRKNAIQYVILHELAHVLSVGEAFHPNWSLNVASIPSTSEFPFFELSWKIDRGAVRYVTLFDDAFPQRRDVVYYFGAKLPASEMPAVYERLGATNFSTLYAVTQPGDDFAEAFATYVHGEMMKKPFEIRILRDGKVAKTYGSCWNLERCAAKRRILERFLEAR